jgi:hypothetical protein
MEEVGQKLKGRTNHISADRRTILLDDDRAWGKRCVRRGKDCEYSDRVDPALGARFAFC